MLKFVSNVDVSSASTITINPHPASACTRTARDEQPASDTSSSDPDGTVAAPPHYPADWPPVFSAKRFLFRLIEGGGL